MADVNVSVVTIDSGMDCFEMIRDAAANYQKVVVYDIGQLEESIQSKIQELNCELLVLDASLSQTENENEREEIQRRKRDAEERLEQLQELRRKHAIAAQTYKEQSSAMIIIVNENTANGVRDMASYLRHIAKVEGEGGSVNDRNIFTGDSNYMVVIIDSRKYPESAEHIYSAIKEGHPAMLTLNRSIADANRKRALAGVPPQAYADRDEYPPASFSEGGEGADVRYIKPSDNRGSGSSFRWQLSRVPDGTRVRFRVI